MNFTSNLKDVGSLIFQVIDDMVSMSQEVYWWDSSDKRTFFNQLSCDTDLVETINTIKTYIKGNVLFGKYLVPQAYYPLVFTCSKLTIEALAQGVKYVKR